MQMQVWMRKAQGTFLSKPENIGRRLEVTQYQTLSEDDDFYTSTEVVRLKSWSDLYNALEIRQIDISENLSRSGRFQALHVVMNTHFAQTLERSREGVKIE